MDRSRSFIAQGSYERTLQSALRSTPGLWCRQIPDGLDLTANAIVELGSSETPSLLAPTALEARARPSAGARARHLSSTDSNAYSRPRKENDK